MDRSPYLEIQENAPIPNTMNKTILSRRGLLIRRSVLIGITSIHTSTKILTVATTDGYLAAEFAD